MDRGLNRKRTLIAAALGGTTVAFIGATAHAQLTITPTFDSSITSLPNAAAIEGTIDAAIANITSSVTTRFPDPVTIDFKSINTGLGESSTPTQDIDYTTYLAGLQANPSKSAVQTLALSHMPAGPGTGVNGGTQVLLTASGLAAIGDTTDAASLVAGNGGFNSVVSFNTSLFNTSRTSGQVVGNYDAQSVETHEIDEVLGIGGNGSTLYESGSTPPATLPTDTGPLDFFRYSAIGTPSFTYDNNALAYFSIDGGTTKLVYFNQVGTGGSDYGDWGDGVAGEQSGNTPGQVQDAFGSPYANGDPTPANLGVNEIDALQVEGYQVTAVPEPTTLSLLALSGLGLLRRRRLAKI